MSPSAGQKEHNRLRLTTRDVSTFNYLLKVETLPVLQSVLSLFFLLFKFVFLLSKGIYFVHFPQGQFSVGTHRMMKSC